MANKKYLKMDGIMGGATDAGHAGEIKVLSYQIPANGLGNRDGVLRDFSFEKDMDISSAALQLACSTATRISKVVLTEEQFNGSSYPFQKVEILEMTDVGIVSFQPGHTPGVGARPVERVTLEASSFKLKYK